LGELRAHFEQVVDTQALLVPKAYTAELLVLAQVPVLVLVPAPAEELVLVALASV
jgi:hypothetical protein